MMASDQATLQTTLAYQFKNTQLLKLALTHRSFGAENNEPIEEINMGSSVYSTPVAANETIFISTKDKLFAIGVSKE